MVMPEPATSSLPVAPPVKSTTSSVAPSIVAGVWALVDPPEVHVISRGTVLAPGVAEKVTTSKPASPVGSGSRSWASRQLDSSHSTVIR